MIVIHPPEETAQDHQTWICQAELHLPGGREDCVTVIARGVEGPEVTPERELSMYIAVLETTQRHLAKLKERVGG